ncbi:histone H2A.Z-specific chaperone CHZ1-like [Nicotiana tomentosiformis]|uniref:histone H2A.Z-specific chaperone CHZ1-like n=1 Tax=Nicotiana tomentosiformis TaxID=4098 RepID=UPI00388C6F15
MKEKSLVQARKLEELEARLASELAKAKSDAEKAKAKADAFVAVYRADAEAAQTLEEIHARDFDFIEEIKKAKELKADAEALVFDDDDDDDDDDDGSKSRPESGEEPDGEEIVLGDNQET